MKKISKKQIEVLEILTKENTYIIFIKGIDARCYIHSDLSYKISTATLFAMIDKGFIKKINEKWNSSKCVLTELGKKYKEQ